MADRHPLDHWTYHAYRRTKELALPVDFIEEGRDIVINAFGREWLEEQFRRVRRGAAFVSPGHPIVQDFIIAGDSQIVEVLELAVYLRRLAGVNGLNQVLPILRDSDQFATGMLQLAYAYRFLKAGGVIELEPTTPEGRKSDIGIALEGRRYLAECYVPSFGKAGVFAQVLDYSAKKLLGTTKHFQIKTRLILEFTREPTQEERSQLEDAGREAIIEASKHAESEKRLEFVQIKASALSVDDPDPDYPDPYRDEPASVPSQADLVISQITVRPEDLEAVKDGSPISKLRGSRILFRWPRESDQQIEERVAILEKRFDDKLLQTRSPGAGRVLIARVREGVEMTATDERVARTLLERLVRRHDGISAIILTARVWTTRSRYRYQGYLLYGSQETKLPNGVARTLMETDYKSDILEDCR